MTEPNRMPTRALDVQHVSALRFVPGCTLSRLKQSHPVSARRSIQSGTWMKRARMALDAIMLTREA
jgi:hypothetical protein